jgi:16S rRNA C967 or C1407 C5-methylase (RsmB/RsmF family)/NOL1/NOP2/fmu family ribosome biogenesis protein
LYFCAYKNNENLEMLHPDFIKRTKELLKDEYEAFEASLETLPPVSIRINPQKNGKRSESQVAWCTTGYYLPERPSFTFDPLFHAGAYYVQEASSMFLEQVIQQITGNEPVVCLDLCAAPGGKSTHLSTILPENSLLVSNEVIRSRCMILAENMTKWGRSNSIVTNNDPKDFGKLGSFFDIIVADLPCSGEGMFRKDKSSRDEWSVANVELCAARQQRIVRDVWDSLRPGGFLIYSTCTFNTEENEDNVLRLAKEFDAEIIEIPVKSEWNISGLLKHNIPACRFFPHKTTGEGFFIAALKKKSNEYKPFNPKITIPKDSTGLKNYLCNPDKFYITENKAININHINYYNTIRKNLKIITAGVRLGDFKGKDFIPSISLALSAELDRAKFPNIELSYNEAIKYLKNESITLSEDVPKGHILVTYHNLPLGFVKNVGNRANNLYPKEWRIRKTNRSVFR